MQKYFDVLRKCPLFDGIADTGLDKILHCLGASADFYDKKFTVFAEGKPVKYIGIVLSGAVQAVQIDYYGNRSILSETGPGEMFGHAFACSGSVPASISYIASQPSDIMLLDCGHIVHTCSHNCGFHQQMIYNLMKDMANANIELHRRIEITSKRSTREKLLTYLSLYAARVGSREFEIPFDRQELADYLEVERSGLSAEISKLRAEGVIESNKRHFIINT
ncbi:MAG: Crp/Fnr family transcriptional regulator [Clostridia bacterium]|nr:Crp/Fnr family transcriptional regulator [Clostridia bacterium]